jgi:hypothetical protein
VVGTTVPVLVPSNYTRVSRLGRTRTELRNHSAACYMHYLLVMIVFKTKKWEKLMFVCSVTLEQLKFVKGWGGYLCEEHGFWGNEIFTHFPCFHSLGIIRSLQSDAFATQNKTALELNKVEFALNIQRRPVSLANARAMLGWKLEIGRL